MKQVVVIHGADIFSNEELLNYLRTTEVSVGSFNPRKDWKSNLQRDLGDEVKVFAPRMPNSQSARYEAWKIWFERLIPFLNDGVVLIGHSLGGIFLMKYLSENAFPKKIAALVTVAAPFECGTFTPSGDLSAVSRQVKNITFFHSTNDAVVDFSDATKYQEKLPTAKLQRFEDQGHFNNEAIPGLLDLIHESF